MGVKKLWEVLESCKKILPINHLENKRICVDLSCWMVRLLATAKSSDTGLKNKVYLSEFFHRLRDLIALNCNLIFVSDGSVPAIKIPAYMKRFNRNAKINKGVPVADKVSLKRYCGAEFSCVIREAKFLGMLLGIPCLDGIEEAEAQCAILNSERLCDGCYSNDSDIFLFGARTVYRYVCFDEGNVACYEMSDIERQLGLGRNSMITLALFFGSDYTKGVLHQKRKEVCQAVKSIGDRAILQKVASEGLSFAMKTKQSKISMSKHKENTMHAMIINDCSTGDQAIVQEVMLKELSFAKETKQTKKSVQKKSRKKNNNGNEHSSATEFSYLDVIEAYLKPKCHSADSDDVNKVLVKHPYQHAKLKQLCSKFFKWSDEVTDDYILPKIAERELRRFNHLRSTSTEFGVDLPLDEMPIKCPVSKIIERKSVGGKYYFEVSWDVDLHGLETSLVPADLLQSACPEKIVEFEGENIQNKKQNHRKPKPQKTDEESSLSDIDRRLQNILLNIEREGTTITIPLDSSSSPTSLEKGKTISVDTLIKKTTTLFVNKDSGI